jgi:NodT family efflux transporter outer membrane factor (OMF) lipoprotein
MLGVIPAILGLLFAGCAAVGPDYVSPDLSVPQQWNASMEGGLADDSTDKEVLAGWWKTFDDATLTYLIERALAGSLDVREAVARVREARAQRAISEADLFPTVSASGSRMWSRSSEETGGGRVSDSYDVGFDAGWELDVFGGVRRSVEASDATLGASREDLRDVYVTLLSEVALNYVDTRSFQERLAIAEANLDAQQETYELALARFESGLTTQLDVEQARLSLETTRARIPTLRSGLVGARNRLSVLLGEPPGAVDEELGKRKPIPVTPPSVAVGIPADVVRQRPDVRRAERQVAAQTARIGVATAELYPKFTLSGSIGLESLALDRLFRSGSRTLRGGPGFSWRVFEAGRIRQGIEVENAVLEQTLAQYEGTVLSAFEEVENALVTYANEQVRRQYLMEASQAAREAFEIAKSQYGSGLIDFEVLLDSQRSLLSTQDDLSVSDAEVTSNLIRLYKALGGGWTSLASVEEQQGG